MQIVSVGIAIEKLVICFQLFLEFYYLDLNKNKYYQMHDQIRHASCNKALSVLSINKSIAVHRPKTTVYV